MKNLISFLYRNLKRKPVYTIITFTGFTIAIAASLLIYLWVDNELSYEKFHPGYRQIYRVLTLSRQGDEIVKSPGCYRPLPKTMKMDYPQIEFATYISYSSEDSPLQTGSGGEKIEARLCWTDEDFFKIFRGFRFIEGTSESAFEKPENIVLSERTAARLFGDQPALGKTLISDKYSKEVYTVGGVVSIPEQSHINFGFMLSEKNTRYSEYANHWGDKAFTRVYIKLARDAQITDRFLDEISNQVSRYSKFNDKLIFQPIADIHLYSDYQHDMFDNNPGNYKYVLAFIGLAFLIVIMAVLNYSVLAVARASERSVEIGIKKTVGGTRAGIFRQFMTESVFQTLMATTIALLVVWFILPWFNSISSVKINFNLSFRLFCSLIILTFLIGIFAGIYPSLYLSALNPLRIFSGGTLSGSRSNFIRILITLQFAISMSFIIATSFLIKQMNYIHKKDLGFDGNNIIVFPTGLWYGNKQFKEALLRNPDILSVSASVRAPVDFSLRQGIPLSYQGRSDTMQTYLFWADEDFAKTYNLKIVKGEFFSMNSDGYWGKSNKSANRINNDSEHTISIPVVINETAEKMLGFNDPIGQRLGDNLIVGVVKDFNFRPLHFPIGPLMISNNPETIQTMNVKIAEGSKSETLDFIRNVYKKYRDNREFEYSFFDDLLHQTYKDETRLMNITLSLAILSVIISILGILGMVTFSVDRRTKEIGIRKVSGANSTEILILLNREFLKWIMLGLVLAIPLSWFTMLKWLENFAYKTPLSWWIFVFAGSIILGIAVLTISLQSWKTSARNPVEALRYE